MKPHVIALAVGGVIFTSGALLAFSDSPASNLLQVPAAVRTISEVTPVQETIQTTTLKVDGLWCPSCGYIVSQELKRTPGVLDAEVSMRNKMAIVTYDSSKTTPADLVAATAGLGFPSEVIE